MYFRISENLMLSLIFKRHSAALFNFFVIDALSLVTIQVCCVVHQFVFLVDCLDPVCKTFCAGNMRHCKELQKHQNCMFPELEVHLLLCTSITHTYLLASGKLLNFHRRSENIEHKQVIF